MNRDVLVPSRRRAVVRPVVGVGLAMALTGAVTMTDTRASSDDKGRRQVRSQEETSAAVRQAVTVGKRQFTVEGRESQDASRGNQSPLLDYYIVQLADASLAGNRGKVPGFAATSPQLLGTRKLDMKSPASVSYLHYLSQKQDQALTAIEQKIGHNVDVLHRYSVAFNGFAIKLTPAEAKRVAAVKGVKRVERNQFRQLDTDAGPYWIGAAGFWNGSATGGLPATKGEGVVVGVIDTGINGDHPSFADIGGDGYDHVNPLGSGNYKGWCNPDQVPGNGFLVDTCNDKLIGQWSWPDSNEDPEDDDGHGSHTASTAAGNYVNASLIAPTITISKPITGVAPHANIIAYDACISGEGCPNTALLASVDQAAADGVDVINYSISGGNDPYNDSVSLAFLDAMAANVFISCSAGNAGPGPSTTGHNEPWTQNVAAATHSRNFVNSVINFSGGSETLADIIGTSLTSKHPEVGPDIVYAGDFGDPLCPLAAPGDPPTFPPGTWQSGEIVICDRGIHARVDKAQSVLDGGAGGFVLANDEASGDSLVTDAYVLPGVHITYDDGVALKAWMAAGGTTATIAGTKRDVSPLNGDILASFSSRGPSAPLSDILKPDVTAPGVAVWAAVNTPDPDPEPRPEFDLISGTSMASPHSAGSAALVRSLHPTWTPMQVKSALMMTADASAMKKEDGVTVAEPFDMGAGRINLNAAGLVGFVLNETAANFDAADPGLGGDLTTLNLASMTDGSCFQTCSWTRTLTSVVSTRTWTPTISAPAGMVVTVTPNPLTLQAGASAEIQVSADVTQLAKDQWYFATITWSDGAGGAADARMPVTVFAQASTDALTVTKTVDFDTTAAGATVNYTIEVANNSFSQTTFNVTDPIPANTTYVQGSATGLTFNPGPNNLTGSTGTLDPPTFDLAETPSPFGYVAPGDLNGGFFVDICTLFASCDEATINLTGVNFIYQGVTYTNIRVNSNGVIAPGAAQTITFENQNLPDPTTPNNVLAPFWADLDGNGTSGSDPGAGTFYVATHNDPVNGEPYVVAGWEGIQLFGSPSKTYTFQIWIKEGTDQIWFVYEAFNGGLPDTADGGLTTGIENTAGTAGFTRFYRELGSCDPGPCNDTGTPPVVGTDLQVNTVRDSDTFTFAVTVNNGTPLNTVIQNVVSVENGVIEAQAVADTLVSLTATFADVPTSHIFWRFIEGLYASGITSGCGTNPLIYCPDQNVPRGQMAVFIIRSMGETPSTAACDAYFSDIAQHCGGFSGFINRLFELNITPGCGPNLYCPDDDLTRSDMAVFVINALAETPSGVPFNQYFDDIPDDPSAGHINRFFELGITSGCGTRLYCPGDSTTRGQMAVFLTRAFDIPLP